MLELILPERIKPLMEDESREQVVVAHRRWFKTRFIILKMLFGNNGLKGALKNAKTIFWDIFPTYRQAKMVAWPILIDYASKFGPAKINETDLRVVFKNGSEISLKGADKPDSLRGAGLDGAGFDEWALQEPGVDTEIIYPALADRQGWHTKVFTPKGQNHAYQDFINAPVKYLFKASQTGVIPADELIKLRREMPEEQYQQEMECEFLKISAYHLFSVPVLMDCVGKPAGLVDLSHKETVSIGVDVARYGDDEIVFQIVEGTKHRACEVYQGLSLTETTGRIIAKANEIKADYIAIDDAGVGGGVTDMLEEARREHRLNAVVEGINVGRASYEPNKYANLRAEIYWSLREKIIRKGVELIDDKVLINQLGQIKYRFNSRGQIIIESKEEMRTRGLASPDRADALVLAYYAAALDKINREPKQAVPEMSLEYFKQIRDEQTGKKRRKTREYAYFN